MLDVSPLRIDRPRFRPRSFSAHVIAGSIIALATLLQMHLNGWAVQTPYIILFPSVVLVTFLCGSIAGCLATLLAVLSAWIFILPTKLIYMPVHKTALFSIGSLTVVGVIAMMRSATAHIRRSNERLRISEGKFRDLLESAPDAIIIADAERRIVLINGLAEQLFGYQRQELLGKKFELLLPEQGRDQYLMECQSFLENARTTAAHTIELDGVRKDGTEFPIEVSLGPIQTEAGLEMSHVVRDISARRETEKGLAQASKAKSDFLASMSHELRTPLNAIIGFSEIMRDAIFGPLDVRYREYSADINQSAQHLRNIINDILDISRIEGGGLELREELVSIVEIAWACERIISTMANAAGVSLEIDIADTMPLLRLDHLRMQQILLNLMSNAVKFTPAGGRVRVSALLDDYGPLIAVTDTGIGMRSEDIPVALEPFRQIEGVLNRSFEGTGLGLPLAKALVELQGGWLTIESAPGAGTSVYVRLPADRMASVGRPSPEPHASAS